MKIKTGIYEVLETGVVHSHKLDPIDFVFSESMIIRIALEFNKDSESVIKVGPVGTNMLMLSYVNPHMKLNFGPNDPMHVGTFDGKKFYCNVRVNVFGNQASFEASYTFFIGEEEAK